MLKPVHFLEISKTHLVVNAVVAALVLLYVSSAFADTAEPVGYETYLHIIAAVSMAAAGAGALNHYYDRDLDVKIDRTSTRPIPAGHMSAGVVLAYGLALACASVIYGYLLINPASALFIALYIFTYAWLYTVWLKRRSTTNIVVVGMSGSAAYWAGWAAATGTLDLLGFMVGFYVMLLYPLHYWNMALMVRDEHERANVRMLPYVIGTQRTSKYLLGSTLMLIPYTLALYIVGMGAIYLGVAAAAGGLLLFHQLRLARDTTDEHAWSAWRISTLYHNIMLGAMILDATFHIRI